MSTSITLSTTRTPTYVPILDKTDRAILTGVSGVVCKPKNTNVVVSASNFLEVTPEEHGELRACSTNTRMTSLVVPAHLLCAKNLLTCIDLVKGKGGVQEAFLRSVPLVDEGEKPKKAYQADCAHLLKLSLRSLVSIKKAFEQCLYDVSGLSEADQAKLHTYIMDKLPNDKAIGDLDMDKKEALVEFEKGKKWRIVMAGTDAEENVFFEDGFESSSVGLKKTSGKKPLTKEGKREREHDELEDELRRSKKTSDLFHEIVDIPGARIFTFTGSYDMSKASFVEDNDGTQSMIVPFAK